MDNSKEANLAERAERFLRTAAGARKLATRLEDDQSTMAWVLAQYREAEDMDDQLMALTLGIDEFKLPHLALCKRPREGLFRGDIESIAEHIGMQPTPLADVVRLVDSLFEFGQLPATRRGGMLAAARDRAAEDPAEYDPTSGDPAQGDDERQVDATPPVGGTGDEQPR